MIINKSMLQERMNQHDIQFSSWPTLISVVIYGKNVIEKNAYFRTKNIVQQRIFQL